ncbi:MAG: PEGA domain-containing protein, partial [Kofleriaceae bacterium]
KPPFEGATYAVLVAKLLTSAPTPIDLLRAGLPPELSRAVHRALEKEPQRRFATADQFAAALPGPRGRSGAHGSQEPVSLSQIELAGTIDSELRSRPPRSRSKLVIAVLSALVLAGVTVFVIVAMRDHGTALASAPVVAQLPEPPAAVSVGTLEVKSMPVGALVKIDGALVGTTPIIVTLMPGNHRVELTLDGHIAVEGDEEVRSGERTTLVMPLQQLPDPAPVPAPVVLKARPGRPGRPEGTIHRRCGWAPCPSPRVRPTPSRKGRAPADASGHQAEPVLMRALALAWLMIVALLGVARADDTLDVREEARRAFTEGQNADKRRDWAKAIEHYLRANELVSHPFAMFNIAADYERLGRLREAAVWYTKYLQATPDEADKARVQRLLADLALRPGTLTVRSTPNGAQVWVDGVHVGTTPYSGHIKGGPHKISTRLEGQQPDERELAIEYGEPEILDVALRGAAGMLSIVGEPQGAQVRIDGMPAGTLPVQLRLVPGPHRIRVTQPGYTAFETTVNVGTNRNLPVTAQLARALGTFSTAPGGTVTTQPAKLDFGYVVGAGGGADLRGEGELYMIEVGTRVAEYDAALRVGKALEQTSYDFVIRWFLARAVIAPFLGGGYSYVSGGFGYQLVGGLRYDIARGDGVGFSIIAESGLRYFNRTTSDPGETSITEMGTLVPLMGYLQIVYR